MIRITPPEQDSWVYVSDRLAAQKSIKSICEDVKSRVYKAQCWLFDLDDNHAFSPGKTFAINAVGTRHYSPSYIAWCTKIFFSMVAGRKDIEGKMWKQYFHRFLSDKKSLDEIEGMLTPDFIRSSLYLGVEDFCAAVSESKRFYVSRNIRQVVGAYERFFGFDGSFSRAEDKAAVVERYFVRDRPHFQSYGVEGDGECDGRMVTALRDNGKEAFGIFSSKRPLECLDDSPFDINVSKDRSGLVKLISE